MAETRSLRTFRIVLWSLVVVAAIAATALFFLHPSTVNAPGGGQFALVDQRGAPVDQTIFEGHPSLLFFGYTHCPDVCPTTMGEMQGWFAALGDEAKSLKGVFITVDPARDTVEQLAAYAPLFHPRLVALTGSEEEVREAARAYRVYYQVPEGQDDAYLVDHSSFVYLMGPDGAYRTHFGMDATPEAMAERISQEIAATS